MLDELVAIEVQIDDVVQPLEIEVEPFFLVVCGVGLRLNGEAIRGQWTEKDAARLSARPVEVQVDLDNERFIRMFVRLMTAPAASSH